MRTVAGTLAALQTAAVLLSARAFAAPTPTPTPSGSSDPCEAISGPARDYCQKGSAPAGSTPAAPTPGTTDTMDPLASLAKGCADAAAWIVGKLSEAVKSTANVDFTNPKFLQQYAVVFAASTVLTLVLWLLAVAKRAMRGVPLATATSEAIGFLWLTVLASAFTPLILYTIVSATDGVTQVIASASGGQTDVFFGSFAQALKNRDSIGGGPIMLIVVALVTILAAGVLWLELVIRAALLYVGALLGTVVYAGLVDKNLWSHVRRWAGIMIAVILVKPVIVIVLGLAGALSGGDGPNAFSAVVSGLAIILLAIFASAMIYRFVPGFGDDIAAASASRKQVTDGARASAVLSSPANLVSQGIKTHSSRGGGGGGGGSAPAPRQAANSASSGVTAHGSRTGNPGPSSSGSSGTTGGTGSIPSAAPSARSNSTHSNRGTGNTGTSNSPHSHRKNSGGGGR
ncbi:hypothetical protein GCM10010329_65560 [Streptomyces spiroverticillatus]|uniref:Integral membrane protein n=1 Tax=Streptomyces finlayi TaxID=67296 RepID=A0A918X574_9ACTN|nr:hypothetical protein GCM10010329_65560 [Streptomyces spiroverticillatus]GHD11248.1 hypothetical protein GCM10010334_67130 [Streptomyces finlayi]